MKLPIRAFQQQTSYSCVASLLQSLLLFYKGETISHERAITLAQCDPETGAELTNIATALKMTPRQLTTWVAVKKALFNGQPIIADDNVSYVDGHAILLVGATDNGVWVLDPNTAKTVWRTKEWLWDASEEFYVLV